MIIRAYTIVNLKLCFLPVAELLTSYSSLNVSIGVMKYTLLVLFYAVSINCDNLTDTEYTRIQRQELIKLGPATQLRYAKVYGNDLFKEKISVEKWNYPTSSVFDLANLFREEQQILDQLKKFSVAISNVRKQNSNKVDVSKLSKIELPSEKMFVEGAGLGIIQIQIHHRKVKIDDIVKGDILGHVSPHLLSSEDCYQLSLAARDLGRLDLQIDWLTRHWCLSISQKLIFFLDCLCICKSF